MGDDGSSSGDAASFPIVAVNWGPWAEAGMAAAGTKAYDVSVADGDIPLSTPAAMQALCQVRSPLPSCLWANPLARCSLLI